MVTRERESRLQLAVNLSEEQQTVRKRPFVESGEPSERLIVLARGEPQRHLSHQPGRTSDLGSRAAAVSDQAPDHLSERIADVSLLMQTLC